MARAGYASLLDDPGFLADLERIEVSGPAAVERPTSLWFVEPAPAPPLASAPWSIARVVIGAAGLFVMMSIGGAAAAYVFADRVALILAR